MIFDNKTLIIVTGIIYLMQVLILSYQYIINRKSRGTLWWLFWSIGGFVSYSFVFLRILPSILPFVIVFQNPIILLSLIFIYIGICSFFDNKINWKILSIFYIIYLITHLFFYLVIDIIKIRAFAISFSLVCANLFVIFNLQKNKIKQIALSVNFNIVIFFVHACASLFIFIWLILGEYTPSMFSPDVLNYTIYFDNMFVSLLITFGFITMLNHSLNEEIKEAKTHFEHIFNSSPDTVLITRFKDGGFVESNENIINLLGYNNTELFNKTLLEDEIWENKEDRVKIRQLILEKGICENIETRLRHKNGEVIVVLVSAKIILIKGTTHIISVIRDISDYKKSEQIIKKQITELSELNATKDKFFSIIAHDLKSPIGAISGFCNMLLKRHKLYDDFKRDKLIRKLNNSVTSTLKLLENLLTWSLSQSESLNYSPERLNLNDLLNNVLVDLYPQAKKKEIKIINAIGDKEMISADKNMLATILRNLISNAIKFTNKLGTVSISSENHNNNLLKISISDNGVGISEDIIDDLFKVDKSSSTNGTENETGTGLGLILCKEFVEKHGGEIWVNSQLGKGSTFSFTLHRNSMKY